MDLANRQQNWRNFYAWARKELKAAGIKVKIRPSVMLRLDGALYRGWFDGVELAAAEKNPIYVWTFVHEFCHFMQWQERPWLFDGHSVFDVLGKRPFVCKDWGTVWDSIALEHDCESRSIRLGCKWDILDSVEYAKRANAYLFFYQYVFLTGKWTSSSLDNDDLLALMPEKLVSLSSLKKIDMRLMEQYDEILAPSNSGPHLR